MFIREIFNFKLERITIACVSYLILVYVSFFGTSLPFSERTFDPYEGETSNPINQIVFISLFLLNSYIIFYNHASLLRLITREKFLSIFILFCLISFIWSDYPFISFKRSFQLFVTFLTIVNSVILISYKKIIKILLFIGLAYAAINYLSCLLIPEAIDPAFATWRGIELSKNGLGYSALMLTIIGITANSSNFERIFYNKLGKMLALLGAGLTIMAFSTTNIIALFVISSILFLKKVSNIFILIGSQRFFFNFFLIIIFILGIITSFYSKEILAQIPGIFGKDTSLTGRDVIWLYIWSEIKKQFLLGYGYGTYWIMGSHIIDLFTAFAGWRVNEAHNGFLEILLQLGLIGFIVFVAILFKYTIKAFRNDNLPSLLLLTGIVIVNFSESFIFNPRDIATFLFMLNYLLLHKKDEQYTALKNDFN